MIHPYQAVYNPNRSNSLPNIAPTNTFNKTIFERLSKSYIILLYIILSYIKTEILP